MKELVLLNPTAAFRKYFTVGFATLVTIGLASCAGAQQEASPDKKTQASTSEYEIGGPMAGIKLPLYPAQGGAEPGFPGTFKDLQDEAKAKKPESAAFTPEGNYPARELRPGSPEIFQAYFDKYMPVRPMFDAQSLIQAWDAPNIPGAASGQVVQYAAPIFWSSRYANGKFTGKYSNPIAVVQTKAGQTTTFNLDLGNLKRGLYCVRLVGAVAMDQLELHRKPVYVNVTVNDGLQGQKHTYMQRVGYNADFRAVAEVYFHATDTRGYQAEVTIAKESEVDLKVWSLELHDALTGIEFKAYKTRPGLYTEEERASLQKLYEGKNQVSDRLFIVRNGKDAKDDKADKSENDDKGNQENKEQRLTRDAALWEGNIPINSYVGGIYGYNHGYGREFIFGAGGLTREQINEQYGAWQVIEQPRRGFRQLASILTKEGPVLMTNAKLGLSYSMADAAANKPLPDPYPFKDNGLGITTPAGKTQGVTKIAQATIWNPVADAMTARVTNYRNYIQMYAAPSWHYAGNREMARDAAIMLTRIAYDYPTMDSSMHSLSMATLQPGSWGRDHHGEQRNTNEGFTRWDAGARIYDWLFTYIKGNQELADSIQRFVPWVKTPDDVCTLIEVYYLRTTVKQRMRYLNRYDMTQMADIAAVQNDNKVTDDWMDWLFTRTWTYPMAVSGLPDLAMTANDRNGVEYIGSSYYAGSLDAMNHAEQLVPYLKAGGNPKYDLRDPKRFPKAIAATYWPMLTRVAGLSILRIGDVAGPDKGYAASFETQAQKGFPNGWKWTKDPKFAWMIEHVLGRQDQTDAEWAEIQAASKTVPRAPWLDQRSRSLPQWAAILETGQQFDDYRFRTAVYLRQGSGWGHQHNDTLDLQVYAHGLPMTVDGGQRPGYSHPADRSTRTHNLVEVDGYGKNGGQWLSHNWTKALVDAEGARYMHMEAAPPKSHANVDYYHREVALIDVTQGEGYTPLTPKQQASSNPQLPTKVTTPSTYVFDVVRVGGGNRHTYAFHAGISDEVLTNASDVKTFEQLDEKDKDYIETFREPRTAGAAPENLTATWRMRLENQGRTGKGQKGMLGKNYSETDTPRMFTRLHLLGVKDQRVLGGSLESKQWGYFLPMLYVQKRGANDEPETDGDLQSVYTAIIEPFAGEPFITSAKQLEVKGNKHDDARKAVAVNVKTVNGHDDLLFSSDRPELTAQVADATITAEYAYYSTDKSGLRQATLVKGTQLQTPTVRITPAAAQRQGKVVAVNYGDKTFTLEGDTWPAMTSDNQTFEIGTGEHHWTTYTTTKIQPAAKAGQTTFVVDSGAGVYLSRVNQIDSKNQTIYAALGMTQNNGVPMPGMDKHWVASNEAQTKFWRAEYLGGEGYNVGNTNFMFKLDSAVSDKDFAASNPGMYLWSYGVGDEVRQATFTNLRRVGDDTYQWTADVDATLSLKGKSMDLSHDGGKTWSPAKTSVKDGWVTVQIDAVTAMKNPQLRVH